MKSASIVANNRKTKALCVTAFMLSISFISQANENVNLEACAKYLEPTLRDKLSKFFNQEKNVELNYAICVDLANTMYIKGIDAEYETKSVSDSEFRDLMSSRHSSVPKDKRLADFNSDPDDPTFMVIGPSNIPDSNEQKQPKIETVRGFTTIQN